MSGNWRTVRVFISSTFLDMHAERNHLVRTVFPELREKCRKKRVHLVDVDLRWGVRQKDAEDGKALDICLDEIDSCRPYFLGLLGHRYGWVPKGHEHSITAQEIYHGVLRNDVPVQVVDLPNLIEGKLEGKVLGKDQADCLARCYAWDADRGKYLLKEACSRADLETLRDVFRNYSIYQRDRSFFFFRSQSLTDSLAGDHPEDFVAQDPAERDKLAALKREIIGAGLPHVEYDNIEFFGEQVGAILWERIEAEIGTPVAKKADRLAEEAELHELFMAGRTKRFVGRRALLDRMHGFCGAGQPSIMVVTGEPGCGKSALLARFTEEARHHHPDWLIIPHFVGASPGSTSIRQTLRRLCAQLSRSLGTPTEIPYEYKELTRLFPKLLHSLGERRRVVLVLDAVNQLEKSDNAHAMQWLPSVIPGNVRILIGALPGEACQALLSRSDAPLVQEIPGLDDVEIRQLVKDYLLEIRHQFPSESDDEAFFLKVKGGNPLYILVALEELRVFGVYEMVGERIARLPQGVPSLFAQVLERVEGDFSPSLVRDCLSLIACGKQGMASGELQVLLNEHAPRLVPGLQPEKLPDMLWARLYRSFSAYLFERSGVVDFFHGQLKEAVQARYLKGQTDRTATHRKIADYFEIRWREPYPRALAELPYQYLMARDPVSLTKMVSGPFFEAKAKLMGVENCLLDLLDIARFFAEGGGDHWESLAACALHYCRLLEDFHETSGGIEALIAEGQVKMVCEIIDREIDMARKGLLMVGVSILLSDAGYAEMAEKMRQEALPVIRTSGHAAPGDCLLHAVLTADEYPWPPHNKCEYPRPIQPVEPRRARSFEDLPESSPRETVPLKYLIPSYFSGMTAWFGAVGWMLAGVAAMLIIGKRFIWPAVLMETLFLFQAAMSLFICRGFLQSHRSEVSRIDAGLARAFAEAGAERRPVILDRMLRFLRMRHAGVISPKEPKGYVHLEPVIREYLASDAPPGPMADFVLRIAAIDESLLPVVATELLHCDSRKLNAILKEMAATSMDVETQWTILRLVMATFKREEGPAYLAGFIPIILFPRSEGTFLELWTRQELTDSLRKAPEMCLGRWLLEAAWQGDKKKTRDSGTIFGKEFWKSATMTKTVSNPLSPWELPVFLAIIGIPFVLGVLPGLAGLILLAMLTAGIGVGLGVLALRVSNPQEISAFPKDGEERERLSELVEKGVNPTPGDEVGYENRSILRTLAAIRLLDGGPMAGKTARAYSEAFNRALIEKMMRHRFLPAGSEAVLQFLGDRKLLEIIISMGPLAKKREMRKPSEKERNAQLRRALPILSRWRSFLFSAVLGVAGTMIWTYGLTKLGPAGLAGTPAVRQVLLLAAFSVFLTVLRHTRRRKKTLSIRRLLLTVLILIPLWILFFSAGEETARRQFSLLLSVLLLTNLLVPTFIAWWRGGLLFFPGIARLWATRLLSALAMVGACIGLSVVTRILFAVLSLLHLRAHWI